jgi:hypothetical protein
MYFPLRKYMTGSRAARTARENGAQVNYGKELVGAVTVDGGVEARFADGSTARGARTRPWPMNPNAECCPA